MHIILARDITKLGHRVEWTATSTRLQSKGIGKTRAEAIDSLVRANVEAFGIEEWTEIDPLSSVVQTDWVTQMFAAVEPKTYDEILASDNV